jgi:hypothetical protein
MGGYAQKGGQNAVKPDSLIPRRLSTKRGQVQDIVVADITTLEVDAICQRRERVPPWREID